MAAVQEQVRERREEQQKQGELSVEQEMEGGAEERWRAGATNDMGGKEVEQAQQSKTEER